MNTSKEKENAGRGGRVNGRGGAGMEVRVASARVCVLLDGLQVKQQQKAPSPSCHDNPDLSSCSPAPIKTLRPSIISMAREQREGGRDGVREKERVREI